MDLSKLGVLKYKVVEWDGEMNDDKLSKRTLESLLALYVSQTFPHYKMMLEKMDERNGEPVVASEIRGMLAVFIKEDSRRLSQYYFNNNTIGISRTFRDAGLRVIEEAEFERR